MSIRSYSRRDFLRIIGLSATGLALPSCLRRAAENPAADRQRPNFVFFLVDDLGWRDLGCYGSAFYETPSVDRLAAEGVLFTDAYAACPVCSPTRSSILTGKYPARTNLTQFIASRRKGKLLPADFELEMALEEVTIAEALKQAGYATCFVGKWHLGGRPFYPENQGFDVNIAGNARGQPPSYYWPYKRGENWQLDLPGGREGEYLTDRLADESIRFIDANKDKPFLLYFSFYQVHTPLEAKPELQKKYEEKASTLPPHEGPKFEQAQYGARLVQDHAVYAGMVESMNQNVGRIMDRLNTLGLEENTIVIFMSDNGGLSTSEGRPTSNLPLRAGKGWLYEGGVREPMIIKWPGVTAPGARCNVPVMSTDFYPTMLEMAGLPLMPDQHADGLSLVPLLKGADSLDRDALYWHYPHYSNQGGRPSASVRSGRWKLIEFYEDNHIELYDLENDIGEKTDLAAAMPDRAAKLRTMLHEWQRHVDARMPTPNPEWKPE